MNIAMLERMAQDTRRTETKLEKMIESHKVIWFPKCGLRKLDFETLFHTGSTQFKQTSLEPLFSSLLVLAFKSKKSCYESYKEYNGHLPNYSVLWQRINIAWSPTAE